MWLAHLSHQNYCLYLFFLNFFHSPELEDSEEIAKSILDELNHELSDDSKHLVGINSRVKEMMNLFSTMSDDVRLIGIWGMAGIGKITLASAIYYRICHQFDASSFIRDIREIVEKDSFFFGP